MAIWCSYWQLLSTASFYCSCCRHNAFVQAVSLSHMLCVAECYVAALLLQSALRVRLLSSLHLVIRQQPVAFRKELKVPLWCLQIWLLSTAASDCPHLYLYYSTRTPVSVKHHATTEKQLHAHIGLPMCRQLRRVHQKIRFAAGTAKQQDRSMVGQCPDLVDDR
jgi:hypothetical protein